MIEMKTLRSYLQLKNLNPDAPDHINEVQDERPNQDEGTSTIHNDSLIPEVKSIVGDTDVSSLPDFTFRVAVIGPLLTVMMAIFKTQEMFIENAFEIPTIVIQYVFSLVMGRAIAAVLPERVYRFRGTQFKFSLNPGPFNAKEQALICIFGYIGTVRPSMVQTVVIARSYFQEDIYWPVAYMATLSSYLMSFLFVGLFMKHLVSSAHMWWPTELVDVAFFRAWHDDNAGSLGSISIKKFFWIFFVLSSIYQLIAGFLFPSISYLSPLCWIWQNSRTVQQIGAGKNGLGLLSFSLDWSSLTSFTDNPLATPRAAILNLLVGYFIILFIVTPAVYWSNAFGVKKFPLMSTDSYDDNGQPYDIRRVLNSNGTFNEEAYRGYSKMHLTAFSLSSYALLFASVATSLVHIVLDRELYNKVEEDIHNRQMRHFHPVPGSWFIIISVLAISLAGICAFARFGPETDFPISAVLAACVSALIVVFPLGIFAATTGEILPVNAAFGLIGGYLFPNTQFDYMIYNNFAFQIAANTVQFMGFLKLAYYMKIPLRVMWTVMVVASVIVCSVSFYETWYQVNKPENACVQHGLPSGSNSTNCPMLDTFYNRSNTWGILGSKRIISDSNYGTFLLSIVIVSIVVQVALSLLARRWKFLYAIKLPIILAAPAEIPFAATANVNTWLIAGLAFPKIASRCVGGWTPKWQYLLATALSGGTGLSSGMLLYFIRKMINIPEWWGSTLDDHCPLASRPTDPDIRD